MSALAYVVSTYPEDVDYYCTLTPHEEKCRVAMSAYDSRTQRTRSYHAIRIVNKAAVCKYIFRRLFVAAGYIRYEMQVITSLMNSLEFRPLSGERYVAPHQLHNKIYAAADVLDRWFQDNASNLEPIQLVKIRKHLGIAKYKNLLSDWGEPAVGGQPHWDQVEGWGYVTLYYCQALRTTVSWIKQRVQFVAFDCQIFCRVDTTDRTFSAA